MSAAIKEKTIQAMSASTLASRDSAVMPVDRIGALAQAPHLGSDLWHMMNLDAQSLRSAIFRLAKKLRSSSKMAQSMAEKVAKQAITEKYIPQCPSCAGVGEVQTGELVRGCPSCRGSGIRRYSNVDRARALGISVDQMDKGWAKRVDEAIAMLDSAEVETSRAVARAMR